MVIPRDKWKWYGKVGHCIIGQWCRFHLCTQVGDYLVSTIGEYVHPRHAGGSEKAESEWLKDNWPGEEIGYGRTYETMVFKAGPPCEAEGCMCGQPTLESGENHDFDGYNDAASATLGHYEMCEKWANTQQAQEVA